MRKVEVTIDIKTSPENVISAFTDFAMLRVWWNVERVLIDKRVGGPYTLAWSISNNGIGFVSSGRIKEYKNDELLVVDNFVYMSAGKPFIGPMTLTVKVKAKADLTELYLCQDGYQSGEEWDWYYEAVMNAWPHVIKTLKSYLENLKR